MMKKILIVLAVLFTIPSFSQVQESMIIEKMDGTTLKLGIEEIKQVYFETQYTVTDGCVDDIYKASDSSTQFRITAVVNKIYDADSGIFEVSDYSGSVVVNSDFSLNTKHIKLGDIVTLIGHKSVVYKSLVTDLHDAFSGVPGMGATVCENVIPVTEVSISEFLTKEDADDVYYRVTGIIEKIANTTYGNLYITDGTNSLYVYGCYRGYGATGDYRKNLLADANIEVGDTLTVIGTKKNYNGTIELYNGIYFSHEKAKAETSQIYREPYTSWGSSVSQTKAYMSDYTLYQETSSILTYIGKDKETLIMYEFENGKLYRAAIAIQTTATTLDAIEKQLTDRDYIRIENDNGLTLLISKDEKTVVIIETDADTGIYIVNYYDFEWLIDSETDNTLFEEPYINWGVTRSSVKSQMTSRGYTLMAESNSSSDNYYLAYEGKFKELYSMYLFDSSMKLSQVAVFFQESQISQDEVCNFLSSGLGYTYVGKNSNGTQTYYLTKDGSSVAIVQTMTLDNGTSIVYVSYISYSSIASARQLTRGTNTDTIIPEDFTPLDKLTKKDIQKIVHHQIFGIIEKCINEKHERIKFSLPNIL